MTKCKSALELIRFLTVYNLFPFKVIQNANIVNFVYYGKTRMVMYKRGKPNFTPLKKMSNSLGNKYDRDLATHVLDCGSQSPADMRHSLQAVSIMPEFSN